MKKLYILVNVWKNYSSEQYFKATFKYSGDGEHFYELPQCTPAVQEMAADLRNESTFDDWREDDKEYFYYDIAKKTIINGEELPHHLSKRKQMAALHAVESDFAPTVTVVIDDLKRFLRYVAEEGSVIVCTNKSLIEDALFQGQHDFLESVEEEIERGLLLF